MSIEHGFGMLLLGIFFIFIGTLLAYYIINKFVLKKERKKKDV
tara:strand:- start:5002 stop:5130 length:129 start_codon:yes stop_codon:yes gene_type:complete